MNYKYQIRQIIYNWTLTLPLDDLSGESIVTTVDRERLYLELISSVRLMIRRRHAAVSILKGLFHHLADRIKRKIITGKSGVPVRYLRQS